MLAPVLATDDPYAAASTFSAAGWKVTADSDREGGTPSATVSLAQARIRLVTATATAASDPGLGRGEGVELQLDVPPRELSGLFLLHRAAGLVTGDLVTQRSGRRGFAAEIAGYRFLILGGDPDPDLTQIGTDPRIAALADGLRQRDGLDSLTDSALRLVESTGESVKTLRRATRAGMGPRSRAEVGDELAEVVVAAAILARQLGVDLDVGIESRLGSPTWVENV